MEKLFEQFKNMLVVYPKYQGYVCGYNEAHFIVAVETNDVKNFFRKLENPYIMEEYKDTKYRYVFADESDLLKQIKDAKYKEAINKN
jgi:hypothetical protein